MQSWKIRLQPLIALASRHPRLLALFGFASGLASFFLVERKESLASIIAIVMLVSWAWLLLENLLTRSLSRWLGLELPPPLLRYATQMVHQESLFFVLPFFFTTTTWNSGQAAFTLLLGLAALVSITDPLYYRWLAPRRWAFMAFHCLTLFAVLLTTLPLIYQLATPQSYRLALACTMLLAFPSLLGALNGQNWRRRLLLIGLLAALGGAGWWARTWVPPATLWLNAVAVTQEIDGRTRKPGANLKRIELARLQARGLYAYTAIHAPRGLNERIYHVWRHAGREVDRIPLEIRGGRQEGYRAWSHKRHFPANSPGRWEIRVQTEAGQLIGVLRFRVDE
ncbi:hypothetical protein AvCA_01770 [Azotobacter vinelandii CA]|uniref:DUF2914 domain-containing protein n=2 Tax=Azotobacter vinelandii TaxID=354 RepID=C1DH32_AZOVD|nr:DUF5924 family protein [Azotobacter vinelandii]ACO76439.1 conserved hypothetical protein [Azotobacter vinelandii DJ]AGK17406.1 hypothetical protein AvCA_01770 [Azotobacter vinelandii CA]AGK19123.1 hypothetical protein AvCA6_01770 [Azotobacter vinelandii CA6]WKN22218.1 DUF2914 domain-containing protein [Azotobacter vinelandii]SFX77508.1 Protein of unknown function [Azotobacter vinelandii]